MTKTIFGCLIVAGLLLAVSLLHAADPITPTTPQPATPATTPTTAVVTIQTTHGSDGVFLTNSSGRSLYMFEIDNLGKSNCTGKCAKAWPPVTVPDMNTTISAAGEANGTLLGNPIAREDGMLQVTYNGVPLYTYKGDKAAGDTKGQGLDSYGGHWFLVKPDGTRLTTATAPADTGHRSAARTGPAN